MAGMRRRSRFSDGSATALPDAVPGEMDDSDMAAEEMVDVSPVNRSTKAYCHACQGEVGSFFNKFYRVTAAYYLPTLLASYSSLLRPHGRQKAASMGTELDGCVIQPLSCPHCPDLLGFHVVEAPDQKHSFRGRDFFKLARIELRCEETPNRFVAVEPQVDLPALLTVELSPAPAIDHPPSDMEIDSRPAPPLPGTRHHYHHDPHPHHQPLQHVEANRKSLPPPLPPSHSPPVPLPLNLPPQKSPSNPPLPSPGVKPTSSDLHHAPPPPPPSLPPSLPPISSSRESNGVGNRPRERPSTVLPSHSPVEHRTTTDHSYPRSPKEVQLDAIERLQTQISQNSSALVAQNRDMRRYEETMQHNEDSLRREYQTQLHHQNAEIHRVDEAVGRLQREMRGIHELVEGLTHEVRACRETQSRGGPPGPPQPPSAQDSALELMAQQIAVISAKANDVETLKITIEIMKNKIQRLENAAPTATAPPPARPYASPREPPLHSVHSSHTVPSHHATPSAVPHTGAPVQSTAPQPAYHPHDSPHLGSTSDASRGVEPPPAQGGWATVNAGTKRPHSNGIDSPREPIAQPLDSPKRPKLAPIAPIEPRVAYASPQTYPKHLYDPMETDDSDSARVQTHKHTLPSQTHSTMSGSEPTLASQHSQAAYAGYGTQDAASEDSWRPESQRIVQVRTPRGRGRGGGPGSRGGRVRKGMATQAIPLGTPEWEKVEWQGASESQVGPDGYYSVVRPSRPIIRRGSGGGGGTSRGGRPSSSGGRAVSLGLQGVTAGVAMGLPADPYAHTKKTRTKPIRNADGVLIRKDGRPDMRSQSSAANLRKVHARKEDHRDEQDLTPTRLRHSTVSAETPSPTGDSPPGQGLTASVRKKHSNVMNKMFPGGVDESRKEHDYAHRVFQDDEDHTAHPRAQHHHRHHNSNGPATRPLVIKRESMDTRHAADSQSPGDDDVEMDHPEDHADDEGQTPGGQSDNSGPDSQYHDAVNDAERAQPETRLGHAQGPQSTVESSSQTGAASSVQAS